MKLNNRSLGGLVAVAAVLIATSALAQQINLKLADTLPLNDRNTMMSILPWMERVTERTNGQVTFTHFPNGQIGKGQDALAMTQSGIVDISYMVPAWISEKLPLVGVAELPGLYADACVGGKAFWSILQEGGLLYETQFKAQNMHPLFPMVQSPYTLWTGKKEIKSLEDLKGLRIRATGSAQTPFVADLGAVPVGLPGPDVHEAMARGTLDGLVFPTTGLFVFDVTSYIKYGYTKEPFGGAAALVAMNADKWNALPDNVKQVMNELADETIAEFCSGLEAWKAEAIQTAQAEGVSVVELPAGASATLVTAREKVQADWAKTFDDRGLPGTEMLEAFRAGVAAAKAGS